MSSHRSRVLTARWIIPVSSPPINGGWVRILDGRVADFGSGRAPSVAEDCGDVAILPGLVNAHTHLEFSGLLSPIGQPGISFGNWISLVVSSRSVPNEVARQQAIERGIAELWASGTVLAGEITTPPCAYPQASAGLDLVTFAEVLGLSKGRVEERLLTACNHVLASIDSGWSPHAPYSLSWEAIEATVGLAEKHDRMLAMHIAESPEERELLRQGTGPLAETLDALGVWQEGLFPWGENPFGRLIDRLAAVKSVLLVHGNQLNEQEVQTLSTRRNITVVYCPRTHHFFRFERHPVAQMLSAGIRVALGTDSRASNPDLNLWREVQFLLQHRTDLDPADVIRMATRSGAEALGRLQLGAIAPDCDGRLGYVSTQASNLDQLYRDFSVHDYQPMD